MFKGEQNLGLSISPLARPDNNHFEDQQLYLSLCSVVHESNSSCKRETYLPKHITEHRHVDILNLLYSARQVVPDNSPSP